MIIVGIDAGTKTGVAVWDSITQRFLQIDTMKLHKALRVVDYHRESARILHDQFVVFFEDARLRKWFGSGNTYAKLQGAGSVKRDCNIWQEFLEEEKILYKPIAPGKHATKLSATEFKALTGWVSRTSEHARDAAMLVYGFKDYMINITNDTKGVLQLSLADETSTEKPRKRKRTTKSVNAESGTKD